MVRIWIALLALGAGCAASAGLADDNRLALSAPQPLVESGFLRYLLPRFALKHGVRVDLVESGAEATLGRDGIAVFGGLGETLQLRHDDSAEAVALQQWLLSDIGRRTIASFTGAEFTPPVAQPVVTAAPTFEGDPVEGARLAKRMCGRCHVVDPTERFGGIGATPSFAVLRTLPDWENRFATFYVLNPHPAFTQVRDITPPFAINLPPTIVPLDMSQDEVEAITAYAATLSPADLGAPIEAR